MVVTLQPVAAHAPSQALVGRLCSTFALDAVDYEGIREATKEQISLSAEALQTTVNETAMKIHLQRVVGSFVGSAHGAAQFYGGKVTQARDLTSKLANDDRDEDREGVYGFETRAARARQFAAEAGLTAYALMAAAEGAVDAYTHVTGDKWKPPTSRRSPAPPPSAARRRTPRSPPSGGAARAGSQDPRPAAPSLRRPPLRWRPQAGRLAISRGECSAAPENQPVRRS